MSMTRHAAAFWAAALIVLLLVVGGCTPEERAAASRDQAPPVLGEVARGIADGHGEVRSIHAEGDGAPVFVFQEKHASRLQQAEIALMLCRLYTLHGLRAIGLEGACIGPNGTDALPVPDRMTGTYEKGAPVTLHEDVVVQMLANGELNCAEMMAAVFADVTVFPIEDADRYAITESWESQLMTLVYLGAIAEFDLSPEERAARPEPGSEEYFDTLIDLIEANDTARELKRAYLYSDCCETGAVYDRIIALAVERGLTTGEDARTDFAEAYRFSDTACERGRFMADHVDGSSYRDEGPIVAMVVGGAHGEIAEALAAANVPHVVIRPRSYDLDPDPSTLAFEQILRKEDGVPCTPSVELFDVLVGVKKYAPSIDQPWCHADYDISVAVACIVREVAGGGIPLREGVLEDLDLGYVTLIPDSESLDDDEAVFGLNVALADGETRELWVRAAIDSRLTEQTLEERLERLISDLYEGAEQARERTVAESETKLVPVSRDTVAAFFADEESARNVRILE